MATATMTQWGELDLDDSSSIASSSSTSTIPGLGSITGKFLETLGRRSLDVVVSIIIRRHLAAIQRMVEKSPHVLRDPSGDGEWKRMIGAYKDLHELCRECRSEYYPLSLQKTAANLIRDITVLTRAVPESSLDASSTNEKWEDLLAYVQRREDLISQWKPTVKPDPDSSSSHSDPEIPDSPHRSGASVDINNKASNSRPVEDPRNRKFQAFQGPTFKSRMTDTRTHDITQVSKIPLRRDPTRKVLVLGAGGVGKSTLVRQLQESWKHSLSQDALAHRDIIINNTWLSMMAVLSDLEESDVSLDARDSFRLVSTKKHFTHAEAANCAECYPMGNAIRILWQDPAVRHSAHKLKFQTLESGLELDSANYFFDSILRISQPDYEPTPEDFVRCCIRTTGMHDYPFHNDWVVTDTGGERSERKKWIHRFDDVTAVIFVVALSDYNKALYEDSSVNRMAESLTLFDSIVNTKWFAKSLVILLLNKTDLFAEKLQSIPLIDHYPDYNGGDFTDACEFFKDFFISLVKNKDRPLIVKYGCALDAEETCAFFSSIEGEINSHYEQNMGIRYADIYL